MSTFLFDQIIFGPVWSRRLGESLGINLMPVNRKLCNFNCIYCECGLSPSDNRNAILPGSSEVKEKLFYKLQKMKRNGDYLNSITFAGNGEPTLHPEFYTIIEDTIAIRNKLYPEAQIAVLSNASAIENEIVFNALKKTDLNILKLDSVLEDTVSLINCPDEHYNFQNIIAQMKRFDGKIIIQSMFFRGQFKDKHIDNTTEPEISAWLEVIKAIKPQSVMIYSIARDTAVKSLQPVSLYELKNIALRVENEGISTQITP